MKVHIGKYPDWIGPYQLAEKICFFLPKKHKLSYALADFFAYGKFGWDEDRDVHHGWDGTWFNRLLEWIHSKKKRKVKVRIDNYDVWSMSDTLAHIVLPMLKKLKEEKYGAPNVDNKDVPKHLRSESDDPWETSSTHFQKWDWVMEQMIFAFESALDDSWQDQFYKGEADFKFEAVESVSGEKMHKMVNGPNHTLEVDRKGLEKYQKRINNGFLLFGKYYQALWS